jgi:hypothetical protein
MGIELTPPKAARSIQCFLVPVSRTCRRLLLASLLTAAIGWLETPAVTQQFVVEEAIGYDPGACFLEGWHGSTASWLLPACQVLPRLEVLAGGGTVVTDDGRVTEFLLQAKVLLHEGGDDSFGIGLVAGMGLDPFTGRDGRRIPGIRRGSGSARVPCGAADRPHRSAEHRSQLRGAPGPGVPRQGVGARRVLGHAVLPFRGP